MSERVDENGTAYAGGQLLTQLYVYKRTRQLDDAIRCEFSDLSDASFDWRSPLAHEGYAEYWDKAFLEHVDLGQNAADPRAFWPTRGPHWDALAVVHRPGSDRPGVALGEGKSYPGELYSSGCQAERSLRGPCWRSSGDRTAGIRRTALDIRATGGIYSRHVEAPGRPR